MAPVGDVDAGKGALMEASLEARVSALQTVAEHAPKGLRLAWPHEFQQLKASPRPDDDLWQEILARIAACLSPVTCEAEHFASVINAGMDPNSVPFPRMPSPCSWGKVLPRLASYASLCEAQPSGPDASPFPLPHVCAGAPHTHAPPDTLPGTADDDAEAFSKWLAGLARSPEELRSAMLGGQEMDMALTPWPVADTGVVAADKCTHAQLKVIELRAKRGSLSVASVTRRRDALTRYFGSGGGMQVYERNTASMAKDIDINLVALSEIRPELGCEAAILEMRARWARDRAQAAREHDERAEVGAAFVAWPISGERKWPPVDSAWKCRASWFKMWRSQHQGISSLALGSLSSLKRNESNSSLNSWQSVSDISWVEVQSQAEECGWQAVLDEAVGPLQSSGKMIAQLDKCDLREIKSMAHPPVIVKVTMDVICILLGQPPCWEAAKRLLGDTQLMDNLLALRSCLPASRLEAVAPYMAKDYPHFQPDEVAKSSKACKSLCQWARELYKFHVMGHAAAEAFREGVARKLPAEMADVAETALKKVDIKHLQELKALGKPPGGVDILCICLLELFAGMTPSIELTTKGNVRKPCWHSCQILLANPAAFLQLMSVFKSAIDEGSVPRRNINRARSRKDSMGHAFLAEEMRKKSFAAAAVCEWVIHMIAYYDAVTPRPLPVSAPLAVEVPTAQPGSWQAVQEAVKGLSKDAVAELKSLNAPPQACQDVCTACASLLQGTSKKFDWKDAKKMMGNPTAFIEEVKGFDPNTISEESLQGVVSMLVQRKICVDMRQKSSAAAELANWVTHCVEYRKRSISVDSLSNQGLANGPACV